MSDSPSPPVSPASEGAFPFAPVPSASTRHDGWTPARQHAFIETLATIGVVSAAAKSVGMSPKSAYALRHRAGEESGFAAAWDDALEEGRRQALDTAIQRALQGERTPVFYRGLQIGEHVRYNDGLLLAAIRAIQPRAPREPLFPGADRWEA